MEGDDHAHEVRTVEKGGAHRKSTRTPFPVLQRLLEITGTEKGEIKEHVREREREREREGERERKKSFL